MPNTYHAAPDVRRVAQDIIREHHDHLITNGVYVKFLFCEDPEKVKGSECLGTARKVSGLNAYLALLNDPDRPRPGAFLHGEPARRKCAEEFFLITIYQDFWGSRSTTDHQRRALVDHELSHCYSEEELSRQTGKPTGKVTLSLLGHDLEEFHTIAQRYGAWEPAISTFAKALRNGQPGLFDDLDTLDGQDVVEDPLAEGLQAVTLTTRQGSVTVGADELARQADRSKIGARRA